jgi:hypothetical protein
MRAYVTGGRLRMVFHLPAGSLYATASRPLYLDLYVHRS